MVREDVGFERGLLRREAFQAEAELLGAFGAAPPTVMGKDRALDLHADGEALRDDVGGKGLGFGAAGEGGPRDEHGGASRGRGPGCKLGNCGNLPGN